MKTSGERQVEKCISDLPFSDRQGTGSESGQARTTWLGASHGSDGGSASLRENRSAFGGLTCLGTRSEEGDQCSPNNQRDGTAEGNCVGVVPCAVARDFLERFQEDS
jgi:hypothetical protein